jgi:cellulose synthase (UDP-forming)
MNNHGRRDHVSSRYLVDVLTRTQKRQLGLLVCLWLVTVVAFYAWWFQPNHITGLIPFSVNSLIVSWGALLPGYYFFFLSRMKRSDRRLSIPRHWRVAMIVTRAPSEPFASVQRMLLTMQAQSPAHDTWLADEGPTPESLEWCEAHNVFVSCRQNVPGYHRDVWPRRKRCKEGNLAYFYDMVGYQKYDFVVQMDFDHIPEPGYLEAMLRPFHDPAVGYVSAPSICDSNAATSWVARGRLYLESHIHGSVQAGYTGGGWTPMCIGSHYAVRTAALKQCGGLGPELAEDHSTTLLLSAHGWYGVHALDAEAHGDGPATFADGMIQEFQWARSLVMIFLTLTPHCLGRLSLKLKAQFLFGQLWYLFFSSTMLSCFLLPVLAVLLGVPFARVNYFEFCLYSGLPMVASVAIIIWAKSLGVLRPREAKLINWEVPLFQLVRWPWVFWGVIDAIRCATLKSALDWRVTPKAVLINSRVPTQWLVPYIIIVCASMFIASLSVQAAGILGYYFLSIFNGIIYVTVIVSVLALQKSESRQALLLAERSQRSRRHYADPAPAWLGKGLNGNTRICFTMFRRNEQRHEKLRTLYRSYRDHC